MTIDQNHKIITQSTRRKSIEQNSWAVHFALSCLLLAKTNLKFQIPIVGCSWVFVNEQKTNKKKTKIQKYKLSIQNIRHVSRWADKLPFTGHLFRVNHHGLYTEFFSLGQKLFRQLKPLYKYSISQWGYMEVLTSLIIHLIFSCIC